LLHTLAKRQAVDLWLPTKALPETFLCIRMINVTIFAVHHLVKKKKDLMGNAKSARNLIEICSTQCLLFSLLSCKAFRHSGIDIC
uniref:Uncharacterized protein n=1 Tax=Chelonoidis abingdonii TaxID=106734 RepID=A0A8C0G416_CHEAB